MRWLDGITDSMDMSLSKLWEGQAGQGGLACCSLWGHKELDTTERLNSTEVSQAEPNGEERSLPFSKAGSSVLGGLSLMTVVSPQDALELILGLQIKLFMNLSPSWRDFFSLKIQGKDTSVKRSRICQGGCLFLALERPLALC